MPEPSDPTPPPDDANAERLADAVRVALLRAAQLQELSDRAKEIAERISKLTPPPEPPGPSTPPDASTPAKPPEPMPPVGE